MKLLNVLLCSTVLLFAAMPAHAGKMAKSKQLVAAEPDMATIVFMRPGKFVGRAIEVPLYDVTGDKTSFLGFVEAGAKVAYVVPPGEHVFMTTIFGGDTGVRFYQANVESGKTYYYRVHIINGLWGMHPVRANDLSGEEFKGWNKGLDLIENSPKTLAWAEENQLDAERKSGFEPKNVPEEFTLHAEDGSEIADR